MIARSRPSADDGPDPERFTPARIARRLDRLALALTRAQFELRGLSPYLDRAPLDLPHDLIRSAATAVADLATRVRIGAVALVPDYLDPQSVPERPILDAIESAPLKRVADQVADQIAARPSDDPTWHDHDFVAAAEPVRPPPVHPAAGPARAAAARRKRAKGQGKPVDPSEWKNGQRDELLAAGVAAALDTHLPVTKSPSRKGRKGGAP